MQTDPSSGEGQRTDSRPQRSNALPQSPSKGPQTTVLDRPEQPRAGLGGLLVVLAVLIGFGVGTRIFAAEDGARAAEAEGADYTLAAIDLEAGLPPSVSARGRNPGPGASDAAGPALGALPIYDPAAIAASTAPNAGEAPPDPFTVVTEGRIRSGESLSASLRRQGILPSTVHLISREMHGIFDFRRSRAGDKYRLGQDKDGRVLDFRYSQNDDESYYLGWEGTRYVARKETAELRPRIAKIAGIVDSSFYAAVLSLGEQSALASDFAQILAWDIDFSRQVKSGDEFQILYERLFRTDDSGQDVYVRPGRILAGRYNGRAGDHTVVYFEDESGEGAYFRPDGTSVERAFLAAPLKFSRISSRFTGSRRHPILKISRPHPGIDYAAPHGTPIWSVAAGTVEFRARAGASGNLIRIRHQNGLTSHYAHLSRFAKGLKVGDRVEQKEIIGFVGSTGLSTGPHVCFRVKRDGVYVDPLKISGPAGDPVSPDRLPVFLAVRDQLLADLGGGGILAAADEAL